MSSQSADLAELQRFYAAIAGIDRAAMPANPLARDLHRAIEALDDVGVDTLDTYELALRLAPVHQVVTSLEDEPHGDARQALELLVRVSDALGMLETPDLSVVPTGESPERFRELYSAIVRLRAAAERLRSRWQVLEAAERGLAVRKPQRAPSPG